jgi:hypothetical protein
MRARTPECGVNRSSFLNAGEGRREKGEGENQELCFLSLLLAPFSSGLRLCLARVLNW